MDIFCGELSLCGREGGFRETRVMVVTERGGWKVLVGNPGEEQGCYLDSLDLLSAILYFVWDVRLTDVWQLLDADPEQVSI